MANLIITIIAIALVAVAALMGAYYGGTAFNSGQDAAGSSALMNQAAQIQAGAQINAATEVTTAISLQGLVDDGALASVPNFRGTAWTWTEPGGAVLTTAAVTEEICIELRKQVGSASSAWDCAAGELTYEF